MYKGLEKRRLGKTGAQVTFIGFGALEIGRDWGLGDAIEKKRPEEEEAGKVLNAVLDLGINMVDTARAYFKSEERIGKYISQRRREYFLATKCGEHSNEPANYYDFSYKAVKDSIDLSLKLLNTPFVDLIQIHFGPDPQKVLDSGETVKAMKDAKAEGKTRFIGASPGGDIARQCIESGNFDILQMDYSLLNIHDEHLIEQCGKKGIGVILRGGLAYGRLTRRVIPHLQQQNDTNKKKIQAYLDLVNGDGDKLTALALQFLYRNPHVTSVLAGTKNIQHLKQNLDLMDIPLNPKIIDQATEIAHSS